MSEHDIDPDDKPVSRRDLRLELRALNNRFILYLVLTAGVTKLNLPDDVTGTALAAIALKAVFTVARGS